MSLAAKAGPHRSGAAPTAIAGRYRLLEKLGSGGMAVVYLGRDTHTGQLVAVKVLHPHLEGEGDFARDFFREAAIARRIEHPNVVAVRATGTENGSSYLLMDYVPGGTLGVLQKAAADADAALSPGVVLRIVLDVLAGLHAAHELRTAEGAPSCLVHRDVSPHNVLVGEDGVAKLTDFGVARIAERTTQTAVGLVKGKLRYMAPEQVLGKELDRRADLWAVAVILWELLANRRLYEGDDGSVIFQLVSGPLPHLAEIRPELPSDLGVTLARGLAREPSDRFASAAELAAALEALGLAGTHADVAAAMVPILGEQLRDREGRALRDHEPLDTAGAAHTATRPIVTGPSAPAEPVRRRSLRILGGAALAVSAAVSAGWLSLPRQSPPKLAPELALRASRAVPLRATERTLTLASSEPLAALERLRDGETSALAIPRGARHVEVQSARIGDVLRGVAVDGRQSESRVAEATSLLMTFTGPLPASPTPVQGGGARPKGARSGLKKSFP